MIYLSFHQGHSVLITALTSADFFFTSSEVCHRGEFFGSSIEMFGVLVKFTLKKKVNHEFEWELIKRTEQFKEI